jgi:hypothetical protein
VFCFFHPAKYLGKHGGLENRKAATENGRELVDM